MYIPIYKCNLQSSGPVVQFIPVHTVHQSSPLVVYSPELYVWPFVTDFIDDYYVIADNFIEVKFNEVYGLKSVCQ